MGGRGKSRDVNFINIALGSACEVEYQLLLAFDLNYLPKEQFGVLTELLAEVRKMLISLHQKIKEDSK